MPPNKEALALEQKIGKRDEMIELLKHNLEKLKSEYTTQFQSLEKLKQEYSNQAKILDEVRSQNNELIQQNKELISKNEELYDYIKGKRNTVRASVSMSVESDIEDSEDEEVINNTEEATHNETPQKEMEKPENITPAHNRSKDTDGDGTSSDTVDSPDEKSNKRKKTHKKLKTVVPKKDTCNGREANTSTAPPANGHSTIDKQQTYSQQAIEITNKIPPVILRNKEKYLHVARLTNETGINIVKAKTLVDGIALHPLTELDYRKLVRLFIHQKLQYHTYQLPSEKQLHVVIKGIPEPIETEEIKNDLESKGFHPENIIRMRSRRDKRPLHMVLATLPRSEKEIYKIKEVLSLIVTVEEQRNTERYGQCHRCQRFGHSQNRCTADPKCVKCAGSHLTSECGKDTTTPAKCVNCGENHPASYRGCKAWPKPKAPPTNYTQKSKSYAQAVKTNTTENNFTSLYEHFKIMHKQMLDMATQLGQMFACNNRG